MSKTTFSIHQTIAQSKDVALNPDHAVEIYYSAEILQ